MAGPHQVATISQINNKVGIPEFSRFLHILDFVVFYPSQLSYHCDFLSVVRVFVSFILFHIFQEGSSRITSVTTPNQGQIMPATSSTAATS